MIYSVFNWTSGKYDYFESPQKVEVASVPQARKIASTSKSSVAPEDAAEVLPANVKQVGSGEAAKGTIAVTREEAAARPMSNWVIGGLVVSAYLLWKNL